MFVITSAMGYYQIDFSDFVHDFSDHITYLGWEDLSEIDRILAAELLEVFKNTYDFWLEELEGKNISRRW